jgi:5-methylcytosine-specific restriction endonuclease McrA
MALVIGLGYARLVGADAAPASVLSAAAVGALFGGVVGGSLISQAFLRVLIHDADRRPINASSRQRHPTERQKRVVKERDRACIDCGSTDLLQYDHQPDYEQTKHTITEELELRCAPCHHNRHAAQGERGQASERRP